MVFSERRNRDRAFDSEIPSSALSRLRFPFSNEVHCKFTAISLSNFFNNYFIFSQWPLIFDIAKFNTSLYRFLLKFLQIVGYSSIYFNSIPRKSNSALILFFTPLLTDTVPEIVSVKSRNLKLKSGL